MNSSDSENDINTPPDIENVTTTAINNFLPEKSRAKYEKAYRDFLDWRSKNGMTSMSEDVLLAYFKDLSNKFTITSMWTIYSMVKSTLNIKHQVDISKYFKLTTFLKRKSQGYKAKKAKIFSPEEIKKFIKEAPDHFFLQSKVALIFGVVGACRRHELYNLQFSDVKVFDKTILVTVHNTKTKTDRTFTVTGSYGDLCKKYIKLRPENCPTPNFFINYSAGKCSNQGVGINKFGGLGKTIANYLNLPDPVLYTGHCFRRTSATLLVDAGGDIIPLKRHGRWRSIAVAESYIDEAMKNKVNNATNQDPLETEDYQIEEPKVDVETKKEQNQSPNLSQLNESYYIKESIDEETYDNDQAVSLTSDQDTCSLYCNLLYSKLKAMNESTRDIAMSEIDRIMYDLKQQDNKMTLQRQPQPGSSQLQSRTPDTFNNKEDLAKKKKELDGIDHLFMSYAETFRKFSFKKQAELKLEQAKMFAQAELSDIENNAKVRENNCASSFYLSINEVSVEEIKEEPIEHIID